MIPMGKDFLPTCSVSEDLDLGCSCQLNKFEVSQIKLCNALNKHEQNRNNPR